jgi:ankyrin repeat protein
MYDLKDIYSLLFSLSNDTGLMPFGLAVLYKDKKDEAINKREEFLNKCLEATVGVIAAKKVVDTANTESGWRPIHWLCYHNDLALIEKIASHGAALHQPEGTEGYYPIDIAGAFGNDRICKFLVLDYLVKIKEGTKEST